MSETQRTPVDPTRRWLEEAATTELGRSAIDPDWSRRDLLILAIVTLVAGAIRLLHLGEWSFWIDEVHTIRDAVLKSSDAFWHSSTSRYPLGFLLLRWLSPLLPGAGEGHFRLLFAFFGLATVPLAAVVFRPFLGGGKALVAAALLALSPWHLFWSQSVRGYTLLMFLALCAFAAYRQALVRGSRGWAVLALVPTVLAVLTHPSAALLVAGFAVHLLLLWRRGMHRPEAGLRAIVVGFWVPLAIALAVALLGDLGNPFRSLEDYTRAKGEGTLLHLASTFVYHMRVPFLAAAGFGLWLCTVDRDPDRGLVACCALVPLLGLAVASPFAKATAYYLVFSLPFWAAMAAHALVELAWAVRRQPSLQFLSWLPLVLVAFELLSQSSLYHWYGHGHRPRWREAADYLERHMRPGDVVMATNEPCLEWYLNPNEPEVGSEDRPGKRVHLLAEWTRSRLRNVVLPAADRSRSRVFVVVTRPDLVNEDPDGSAAELLAQRFHHVRSFDNWLGPKDMTVHVYRYEPID